ncbi:MAG: SUMF1/EgtB/PvdO family nonheme iron enzyme [bacterium]|nr:SUMF1/EgtB/PvdO family nonheme iron enzyme [bacterium]
MINTTVGGYENTNFLGRTGGLEVYCAVRPEEPEERYAVRVIPRDAVPAGEFDAVCLKLARSLKPLDDPSILRYRDLVFDRQAAFLVTELPEGRALSDLVEPDGIHSLPHALGLFKQVLDAVGAAHAAGTVHGGLSAEVVTHAPLKAVKVDGFAIHPALQRLGRATAAPPAGYLAPEVRGNGAAPSVEGDIYALGAMLVFLLTGRPPEAEAGEAVVDELRARRPGLPSRLLRVVAKATAERPEDRYGSVSGLEELVVDPPPVTEPARPQDAPALDELPEMVLIPGGPFVRGNDRRPNEAPAAEVEVPAFEIGRYPITNRQYRHFCEDSGYPTPRNPAGWGDYLQDCPEHPVIGVRWKDADACCQWLSQTTGRSYRLPTESEWEKAARGGLEGQPYPWGDGDPIDRAHFDGRLFAWVPEMAGPRTQRVGCYPANGYGLADMAGNVWEWTAEWYARYGAPESERRRGVFRVIRGGSWASHTDALRCAYRRSYYHATGDYFVGFRCVRSPE